MEQEDHSTIYGETLLMLPAEWIALEFKAKYKLVNCPIRIIEQIQTSTNRDLLTDGFYIFTQ